MKAGIITQARTTSTRLPNKIFKEVEGKPLLAYHIDRLKQAELPICIATTVNQTDDVIVDFAKEHQLPYYRGSEDDVLSRFYEAAVQQSLDVIVRVTSDCPLIDGTLIRQEVKAYIQKNDIFIYRSNCILRTYPRGFDFEIFSFRALKEAFEKATSASDREHVTPFLNQGKISHMSLQHVLRAHNDSQYRLTVDTADDLLLIEKLIHEYKAHELTAEQIIAIMQQHPELHLLNAHIEQKKI